MTTTSQEALQLAKTALLDLITAVDHQAYGAAIHNARSVIAALSQQAAQEPQPVGLFYTDLAGLLHQVDPDVVKAFPNDPGRRKLYAAAPAKPAEQEKAICYDCRISSDGKHQEHCPEWSAESSQQAPSTAVQEQPDLFKAEKLVPYEIRYFESPGMAEALGYKVTGTYRRIAHKGAQGEKA